MNGWIDFLYAFLYGALLLLSVLGLWLTAIMPGIDRWSKRFFQCFFIPVLSSPDCFGNIHFLHSPFFILLNLIIIPLM